MTDRKPLYDPAAFRAARLAAGLTQEDAAIKARCRQGAISRIERGAGRPSLDLLARVAGACGKRLDLVLRDL